MNSLEEAKQSVIEDFSMYDEWLDKYEYLIDLGKNLEAYPESEKTEDKLIKGCQSRVWLDWRLEERKTLVQGRQRRDHHERHNFPSDQCLFWPHTERDRRGRFRIHQPDRS